MVREATSLLLRTIEEWTAKRSEPHDVEDEDMLLGAPKFVWVLLCDILAIGCFVAGIRAVTLLAKKKPVEEPPADEDVVKEKI
mmetsp:Transcript_52774/g.122832  ORF Transcript_52774/g.122832 Transcript_52774/m.122832 type:complete len:83 (+) Transcript_52774:100-348(+)